MLIEMNQQLSEVAQLGFPIDYWRAVPPTSNTCLGSALSDDELLLLSPEELCKDRLSDEYFRLKVLFPFPFQELGLIGCVCRQIQMEETAGTLSGATGLVSLEPSGNLKENR